MSGELQLEIEITDADRQAFDRHVRLKLRHLTRAARERRQWWAAAVGIGLAVLIVVLDRWRGSLGYPTSWLGALLVGAGLSGLIVVWGLADVRARQAAVRADRAARSSRSVSYVFDEQGVRVRSEHSEARMKWSGIAAMDQTPTHVFVMHNLTLGWILPRRLLSAEQLESLRTLVREHVQSGPLPAEPGA